VPFDTIFGQDAFDDHFLGELLVIIERAVNMAAEERSEIEQLRFLFDKDFVRATGQVHREGAFAKILEQKAGAVHQQIVRGMRTSAEAFQAMTDAFVEAAQVFVLVPKRLARSAAALLDPVRQLDHLVNGLFAVQAHDVVVTQPAAAFFGFPRVPWEKLGKHGDHHLGPALPD